MEGPFLPMSMKEKKTIFRMFAGHISRGQVKLMRAAHLDFLETQRKGIGFKDAQSQRFIIDCFTSAGCFNVGRGNEEIISAIDEAAKDLDMGSSCLTSHHKLAFAKKLASVTPGDLTRVLFSAGGGEAIDGAIKLARGATGHNEVISMIKAYHGHSGFSLSANGKEYYRHLFEPLMPGFSFVPFGDLDAVRRQASDKTAAIILEPVQGEGGIFVGDDFYLRGLRQLCDDLGIMLIFDEIQTGFGRTGKMFASEHSGVIPDIMAIAKSVSGGLYPTAAVVYRDIPVLVDFVDKNPWFHRCFSGGSDLGCVAASRVLDYFIKNRLWENAERMGVILKEALLQLQRENPKIIREIRGRGLMIGIEYLDEYMGALMADSLSKHGIFAVYSGNQPQVMRFMLPITITREEIERVIVITRAAVATMKVFLPLTEPLAKIPGVRLLLNNIHVQITVFEWIRLFEDLFASFKKSRAGEVRQ